MTAEELCLGKWTLDLSCDENIEAYFKAVGLNKALRIIAKRIKETVEYTVDNGTFKVKSVNTFKNSEMSFKLGESFDQVTVDNKKCVNLVVCEGNKFKSLTKGYCESDITSTREFFDDHITETLEVKDVVARRRYNKV